MKKTLLNKQKGVTLIEALIAMVIFSVSVLGLAAMQLTSLSETDEVKKTTVISFKMQELVEKMQSTVTNTNPSTNLYGAYQTEIMSVYGGNAAATNPTTGAGIRALGIGADSAAFLLSCTTVAVPAVDCSDGATVCTSAQLVTHDVWTALCDPDTGLAATAQEIVATSTAAEKTAETSGVIGLGDGAVQVAMFAGTPNRLFVEIVSNTADQNTELSGTVEVNLCGTSTQVDPTLDVYCARF